MAANSQEKADVHTESSDVSSSLARNSKNSESFFHVVSKKLGFINCSDSEFSFDGRNLWGFLEKGSFQGSKNIFQFYLAVDRSVQSYDSNVLFTSRLLRFDQSCGSE